MSYGKEYLEEHAYELYTPIGDPNNEIWTTRDGKKMHVKNMTTKHIVNCLKILKDDLYNDCWNVIFTKELKRRGYNVY